MISSICQRYSIGRERKMTSRFLSSAPMTLDKLYCMRKGNFESREKKKLGSVKPEKIKLENCRNAY